jgi:hypothetical protein
MKKFLVVVFFTGRMAFADIPEPVPSASPSIESTTPVVAAIPVAAPVATQRWHASLYGGITALNSTSLSIQESTHGATIGSPPASSGKIGAAFGVDIRRDMASRPASVGFAFEYSAYNGESGTADNQLSFFFAPRFRAAGFLWFSLNAGAMMIYLGDTSATSSDGTLVSLSSPAWALALSPRIGFEFFDGFGVEIGYLFATGKINGLISGSPSLPDGSVNVPFTRMGLSLGFRFDFL